MKARRLVSVAALAVVLCVSAPSAFAGDTQQPWDVPGPDSCSTSLLDAALAGVQAALTVL
jgi:hypothetical protein